MRIAVSGSAGTGKSTLAIELSKVLGLPFISEGVREYLQSVGINNFKGLSPQDTMQMQHHILNNKLMLEDKYGDFVADRSTADSMVYTLRWGSKGTPDKEVADYIERCLTQLKTYDLILFCPWNSIAYEQDGLRSSNIFYQLEISMAVYGILSYSGATVHIVKETSLEERVKEVLEIINRLHKWG